MTNPYASFLGSKDPRQVIARTPADLETVLAKIADPMAAPAPGKWSARDILAHLADTEIVFAFRLRQALSQDHHVIQPFDQDRWADRYAAYDAQAALALFTAVRMWNLMLIGDVKPGEFSKVLNHPERGDMTFQTVVETMGGHDQNHLRQLEALV